MLEQLAPGDYLMGLMGLIGFMGLMGLVLVRMNIV